MTRVTRQVEQAYDAAKGRTVAHLDSAAMERLGVHRDDVIAIEGDDRTVVTVARQRDTDTSGKVVRIDGFTRSNAGIDPGTSVDIEPVEVSDAEAVTVRPTTPQCCPMTDDHAPQVTNELLGTPIRASERRWVMVGPHQQFGVVVGSWRPIDVVSTSPEGPVVVARGTDLTVESAIDDSDEGTAGDAESWAGLRETVFDRDGHACRNCGVDFDTGSVTLQAHFIVSPHHGGVVTPDNAVTLCRQCHAAAHQHVTTPSV